MIRKRWLELKVFSNSRARLAVSRITHFYPRLITNQLSIWTCDVVFMVIYSWHTVAQSWCNGCTTCQRAVSNTLSSARSTLFEQGYFCRQGLLSLVLCRFSRYAFSPVSFMNCCCALTKFSVWYKLSSPESCSRK